MEMKQKPLERELTYGDETENIGKRIIIWR